MRKRILFLINSLAGGGAERVMTTLLAASKAELETHEVALGLLDREPAAYAVPPGVEVHQLDGRFSLLRSVRQVRGLVGRVRPDLTLSFLTRSNLANVIASAERGSRCVISERSNTSQRHHAGLKGRVTRTLIRAAYNRADAVVAVSEGVGRDLAETYGVPGERIRVIANPVDMATIHARAAEPPATTQARPYVMGMGRLIGAKNFALLVKAFAASRFEGDLLIVGEGPERPALEALAARLGLAGRIHMPGFAANPFPLLKQAEMFVLPSNAEGFPNSLVEAMSLGIPVISANCASGPSEILAGLAREAVDGLRFADHGVLTPTDAVGPMTEALDAMTEPGLRGRYAQAGPRRAKTYGLDEARRGYWAAIGDVLASDGRRVAPGRLAAVAGG